MFFEEQLLTCCLRPSNQDAAKHSGAVLRLLVRRIRQEWPGVQVVFRADSGFCRDWTLSWCELNEVDYVVGMARNQVLNQRAKAAQERARRLHSETGEKQRLFDEFRYGAKKWKRERRVIAKAEHTHLGPNRQYVLTTLKEEPQQVSDGWY